MASWEAESNDALDDVRLVALRRHMIESLLPRDLDRRLLRAAWLPLSGPGPVSWPPVSYWRQGSSTLPWPALRGSTTPRIVRPLRPRWCVLSRPNPLPIHRSRIADRMLFAISSRRFLIFSSTDYDDLELPRHLRRVVHTFAHSHIARGCERRDRERATRCFCTR